MIIDVILDRKADDEYIAQGFTHINGVHGELIPLAYDAERFYRRVRSYGEIGDNITMAMDYGTEKDVREALCAYIIVNEYNPAICDYINSRNWLE